MFEKTTALRFTFSVTNSKRKEFIGIPDIHPLPSRTPIDPRGRKAA
jgi:hypothetical protein